MGLVGSGLYIPTAPDQYAVGKRCAECPTLLSRYNPYVICGPCRVRMANAVAEEEAKTAEGVEAESGVTHFAWERFPRRQPVRRGPLLDETIGISHMAE